MTDIEQEMAERFYGFGRWDAPYWFIGPEQGQAKDEKDELGPRLRAWEKLGKPELADLKEFHDQLRPGMWTEEGAPLQKTWDKLILLLMSFKDEGRGVSNRLEYQQGRLGRSDGETCLIELSGLPANSSKTVRVRKFSDDRIKRPKEELRKRISERSLKFIVMYGKGSKSDFESVLGSPLKEEKVTIVDGTPIILASHPVAPGTPSSNQYWIELGSALRSAL